MTESDDNRLCRVRTRIVPKHLKAIAAGQAAIGWDQEYDPFITKIWLQVHGSEHGLFDGDLVDITEPIIFQANVSCRLLLAFLGIGITGATPPMLCPIGRRRPSDIGIEHYRKHDDSPLEKLDLPRLSEKYGDNVLSSWASVIAIVNKRLSHLTDDSSAREEEADKAMATTFSTVPDLVRQEFLEKL